MAKLSRGVKIGLWIAGSVVVLAAFASFIIYVLASRAVNTFRDAAANQLNTAVAGKTVAAPVTLNDIWLGDILNHDYKKLDGLQSEYQKLLGDVKNYVMVLNIHNALVSQYNSGINGDKPLSGDVLKTVNQYLAAVQSRFASEKDRVAALTALSSAIASNTDFDAVSSNINTVLQSNDDWLTDLRNNLNTRIANFQKQVE